MFLDDLDYEQGNARREEKGDKPVRYHRYLGQSPIVVKLYIPVYVVILWVHLRYEGGSMGDTFTLCSTDYVQIIHLHSITCLIIQCCFDKCEVTRQL